MTFAPELVQPRLGTLGAALERGCAEIVFAYLFGSAAEDALGPRSDIDVAVYLDPDSDLLARRLEAARLAIEHLGTDDVDLVVLNSAPIALAGRILGTRRVILDRDPFLRHRYESLTARMYHDFRIRERRLLDWRFRRG